MTTETNSLTSGDEFSHSTKDQFIIFIKKWHHGSHFLNEINFTINNSIKNDQDVYL